VVFLIPSWRWVFGIIAWWYILLRSCWVLFVYFNQFNIPIPWSLYILSERFFSYGRIISNTSKLVVSWNPIALLVRRSVRL